MKNIFTFLLLICLFPLTHTSKAENLRTVDKAYDSFLKGNYDEALNLFQDAYREQLLKKDADSILLASILANIGSINVQLGLYDRAIDYYLKAETIYSAQGEKELVHLASVQVNLANCFFKNSDMEKARSYYENADRIFKQLKHENSYKDKSQMNNLYESLMNNLSNFYAVNLDYSQALEYNDKAFKITSEYRKEYLKWIYRGYIYFKLKKFSNSLECYNTALKVLERDHGTDFTGMGQILSNLGQVYLNLNNYDKALDNLQKLEKNLLKNGNSNNVPYS